MSDGPRVGCEGVIPTVCVGDVDAALAWYVGVVGCDELWRWGDPPRHAAVKLGTAEFHLSCEEPAPGGFWLYFVVDDVDALHEHLSAGGTVIDAPPEDQEWGMREMPVRDPVGNQLCFAAPLMARTPALPIRREEVSVRLEERLAAVLRDLAEFKGMTVGEALEETLLHTFEPLGDGVASPHTAAQLRRIATLKETHGLDYDCHASYRFVEGESQADTP